MRTPATLSSSLHQWAVLTRGSSAIGLRKLRHENDLAGLGRPDAIKHFVRRPSFGERRSEEHTSELQSLMRISYAVFCLKKKKTLTDNILSIIKAQLIIQISAINI